MFQRLKEAIDSRIAEEQARQGSTASPSSSSSPSAASTVVGLGRSQFARLPRRTTDQSSSHRATPRRRGGAGSTGNALDVASDNLTSTALPPQRGPDPNEFDSEFVVGDDDAGSESASGTPKMKAIDGKDAGGDNSQLNTNTKFRSGTGSQRNSTDTATTQKNELPTEVRVRLRRLDKLEARYQDLLRAYRIAHARVLSIEPFEASLRENTPLTSIADPKAFTEYLNQLSLKSDMITEELKRVTCEKDKWKNKSCEYEKKEQNAREEIERLKKEKEQLQKSADPLNVAGVLGEQQDKEKEKASASPATSTGSKADSVPGISVFSPKQKPEELKSESEDLFSYESEIPRLEGELSTRTEEVETLKGQVASLQNDLNVARESTEGMARALESATFELTGLRDARDRFEANLAKEKNSSKEAIESVSKKLEAKEQESEKFCYSVKELKAHLKEKTDEIEKLKKDVAENKQGGEEVEELKSKISDLEGQKVERERKVEVLQGIVERLRKQIKTADEKVTEVQTELNVRDEDNRKLIRVIDFFNTGLKDIEDWPATREALGAGEQANFEELRKKLAPEPAITPKTTANLSAPQSISSPAPSPNSAGGNKKKNKKKKKGGNTAASHTHQASQPATSAQAPSSPVAQSPAQPIPDLSSTVAELKKTGASLTAELTEKEDAIDRLHSKLKGEDDLKEEIESLRDDLLNMGQEYVEGKDRIKQLVSEKAELEKKVTELVAQLSEAKEKAAEDEKSSEEKEALNKEKDELSKSLDELKDKTKQMESDLSAAENLASSRFKELTDLRSSLEKIQPELRSLRAESAELKTVKEELTNKNGELKRLERRHEDVRNDIKNLRARISEQDAEARNLTAKLEKETAERKKADAELDVAKNDLRFSEKRNKEVTEANERTSRELSKAQEDLNLSRQKMTETEETIRKLTRDVETLKDEIQLKTAQHASAQSLMNSMRDQTAELVTQVKEANSRCDSLEEEVSDAHRLLSERTREAETMRSLLADVEARTEAKIRDYKERLETTIEERDKAEDEASTVSRKRAREMEELKNRVRDAEKALRRAEEDKEELESKSKDWKKKKSELETETEKAKTELVDVQNAMEQLRDALDESEKTIHELEKEKKELRRSVEETTARLDKLRRANKALTEEAKSG
ncbi:hypothetical protein KEM56_003166, partial [Ascosphaera pollenicola]